MSVMIHAIEELHDFVPLHIQKALFMLNCMCPMKITAHVETHIDGRHTCTRVQADIVPGRTSFLNAINSMVIEPTLCASCFSEQIVYMLKGLLMFACVDLKPPQMAAFIDVPPSTSATDETKLRPLYVFAEIVPRYIQTTILILQHLYETAGGYLEMSVRAGTQDDGCRKCDEVRAVIGPPSNPDMYPFLADDMVVAGVVDTNVSFAEQLHTALTICINGLCVGYSGWALTVPTTGTMPTSSSPSQSAATPSAATAQEQTVPALLTPDDILRTSITRASTQSGPMKKQSVLAKIQHEQFQITQERGDFISALKILMDSHYPNWCVEYHTKESGPDHKKTFVSQCVFTAPTRRGVAIKTPAGHKDKTKKAANQHAAHSALLSNLAEKLR